MTVTRGVRTMRSMISTCTPSGGRASKLEFNRMKEDGLLEDGYRREGGRTVQDWILTDRGREEAAKVKTGDASYIRHEAGRREDMWQELIRRGGPANVDRSLLRELQIVWWHDWSLRPRRRNQDPDHSKGYLLFPC